MACSILLMLLEGCWLDRWQAKTDLTSQSRLLL